MTSAGATLLASFAFEEPVTIMRARGQISVRPTVFTGDLDIVGAIGMGVVSAEAAAAGVASIPEPFNDADWGGWFVWRSFSYRIELGGTPANAAFLPWFFEVDSKAMRKAKTNDVVVIVAESQQGAFNISPPIRLLVKLS